MTHPKAGELKMLKKVYKAWNDFYEKSGYDSKIADKLFVAWLRAKIKTVEQETSIL